MKTFKQIKEEMAMSATGVSGGGPIAGLPPDFPPVAAGVTTKGHMLRRPKVSGIFRKIKDIRDKYTNG